MTDKIISADIAGLGTSLVPLSESNANEEFGRIIADFKVSDILKEIGRYRIWRLRKTGNWKNIVDAEGNQLYNSWEDVVTDLSDKLDTSRQNIFDRVRTYEQLNWLGYSDQESIKMVAEHPYLYTNALNMMVDWDQRNDRPRKVLVPEIQRATEEDAKEHLRNVLEDTEAFDKQQDALSWVSETVLGRPQCDFYYDGEVIRCVYMKQSIDENGVLHTDESGTITFYPDKDLPAWSRPLLEKAMKSVGKFKTK